MRDSFKNYPKLLVLSTLSSTDAISALLRERGVNVNPKKVWRAVFAPTEQQMLISSIIDVLNVKMRVQAFRVSISCPTREIDRYVYSASARAFAGLHRSPPTKEKLARLVKLRGRSMKKSVLIKWLNENLIPSHFGSQWDGDQVDSIRRIRKRDRSRPLYKSHPFAEWRSIVCARLINNALPNRSLELMCNASSMIGDGEATISIPRLVPEFMVDAIRSGIASMPSPWSSFSISARAATEEVAKPG